MPSCYKTRKFWRNRWICGRNLLFQRFNDLPMIFASSREAWLWTHLTLGTDTVPGMTVTSGQAKFGTSRIWDYTTDRIEHPVGSTVFNIYCHTNLHYSLNHLHLLLSWNYMARWFKYPQCKQGLLLSDHLSMNCKWLPWMRILRKLNINTRRPNVTSLNTRQLDFLSLNNHTLLELSAQTKIIVNAEPAFFLL